MLPKDDKLFAHRMVKKTDPFKSLTDANGRSLLLVRVNIKKSKKVVTLNGQRKASLVMKYIFVLF